MTRIQAKWLENPATQAVCRAISRDGAQALFVGGCVRNTLLGATVSDIDISTDATPQTVMDLARAAKIKAVPTGIDHGTVTLVCRGLAHEVTTFRRDVSTDGRRAIVAFSTEVAEDAARRDFTMNAIYARPDGSVLDPLNGLPDLQVRRVRFIGTASHRIREDYLRSLRYFRFHAWYGDQDAGFDPDALDAIADNLDGLATLSHERVGAEMLKLLGAPDPAPSVAAMRSTGALAQFLPGADDRMLAPLVELERQANVGPDSIRRLAILGGVEVQDALRLSKARTRHLSEILDGASSPMGAAEAGFRLGQDRGTDAILLRQASVGAPWETRFSEEISKGASAEFPVRAADLMPRLSGPAIGQELARLEREWIVSDFTLTKADLLRGNP